MFGRQPKLPVDFLLGDDDDNQPRALEATTVGDWLATHANTLQMAYQKAGEHLAKVTGNRQEVHHAVAAEKPLAIGTKVYLRNHPQGRHKIADLWGSVVYTVVSRPGEKAVYKIALSDGSGGRVVNRREIIPCPTRQCMASRETRQPKARRRNPRKIVRRRSSTSDSSSDSDLPIVINPPSDPPSSDDDPASDSTSEEEPRFRRSFRPTKGVHSNPFREPRSALMFFVLLNAVIVKILKFQEIIVEV